MYILRGRALAGSTCSTEARKLYHVYVVFSMSYLKQREQQKPAKSAV